MLILSRVCAEFTDQSGAVIHRITPAMIGSFHDAPDAIKGDLLFDLLVRDGSILTPQDAKKDRSLEQDPMAGADASGKALVPEKEPETGAAAKPARAAKAAKAEKE